MKNHNKTTVSTGRAAISELRSSTKPCTLNNKYSKSRKVYLNNT